MESENDALLRKCEELIVMLQQHQEHDKLRALLDDIEAFRDRLLAEQHARSHQSEPTGDP